MTVEQTDASSSDAHKWQSLKWEVIEAHVYRLQMRIAKAVQEKRWRKVKALQWLLTHSYHGKLLSIKQVTSNKGAKTAGVDGQCWLNPAEKMQAVTTLKRRGYYARPLRRVMIPKNNGKLRALGIPTIRDRAMQALYLLALEPISEMLADHHSYGFRPKRSTADAIDQCFNHLCRKSSAQWILEGDIQSCFDNLSHSWLLEHIPMDKQVLRTWLTAGYLEKQMFYPTEAGTPQGGVISPTLANMALDGLEAAVKQALPKRSKKQPYPKVHVIRYADDFIITGANKAWLEEIIKPAVERFLQLRGLTLSREKTRITSIDEGFSFLGFYVRKYHGVLLIKPSREAVKKVLGKVREIIKVHSSDKTEVVISKLNNKIRGWAYYYRSVVAKETFKLIDHCVFEACWRWAKFRHGGKSSHWVKAKYFRVTSKSNWTFSTIQQNNQGERKYLDLFKASYLPIKRHTRLIAAATPYHAQYRQYFADRKEVMRRMNHGYWMKTDAIDWRDFWES